MTRIIAALMALALSGCTLSLETADQLVTAAAIAVEVAR